MAISFGGVAYLVWLLAVGVGRSIVNGLSGRIHAEGKVLTELSGPARWLCNSFFHAAVVFDVVGVLWLVLSLLLIVGASRQRWTISWPWMSAICQAMTAAVIAAWAGLAARSGATMNLTEAGGDAGRTVGWSLMSISAAVALLIWVTVLVWLLYERARLGRGPTLRDGLKTHVSG